MAEWLRAESSVRRRARWALLEHELDGPRCGDPDWHRILGRLRMVDLGDLLELRRLEYDREHGT